MNSRTQSRILATFHPHYKPDWNVLVTLGCHICKCTRVDKRKLALCVSPSSWWKTSNLPAPLSFGKLSSRAEHTTMWHAFFVTERCAFPNPVSSSWLSLAFDGEFVWPCLTSMQQSCVQTSWYKHISMLHMQSSFVFLVVECCLSLKNIIQEIFFCNRVTDFLKLYSCLLTIMIKNVSKGCRGA